MRTPYVAIVMAVLAIPIVAHAQPPVGGGTIRPDGPGRYVVENSRGQRTGTLVESSKGVWRLRNELGQLSDWSLRKREDGGWDYVPSPFGAEKKPR